MTDKEKAKAYDEAIKRAKEWEGNPAAIDYIFPELKESNDDKIKNKLINLIKTSSEVGGLALHKWEADEMLTWLEKQTEKLPVGFYYVNSEGKKFYSDTFKYGDVILHVKQQGEQKPADGWKPSEEQLNNILDVILFDNCTPKRQELLKSLYEQLKNLK